MGAFAALAFAATPAAAEPVLDANCPEPDESTFMFGPAPGGNGRQAQTFTAGITGSLTSAQMEVVESPMGTANYIIQIVEVDGFGVPTNTVLASATIPDAAVPTGESPVTGTFATPVAVTAGQQYAVLITRPGSAFFTVTGKTGGDDCPGSRFTSQSQMGGFTDQPTTDLIFAVFVEPSDLTPPDTTIVSGPKEKTRKKDATFEFAGSDVARAVSGFQCRLDAGTFSPCTSPYTVKVKKGKHTFEVQAVDQAGNADPTPATDSWKRKKKKKKKG